MTFNEIVQTITTHALPVLLAITLHEAAHGLVAKLFGDNTAWALGRVTINPFPHIDPIGTIVMPLLLYVATSGSFLFGYASLCRLIFPDCVIPNATWSGSLWQVPHPI